jgi:hypothetical protein
MSEEPKIERQISDADDAERLAEDLWRRRPSS